MDMEEHALIHQSKAAAAGRFFSQMDHCKRLLIRFWWIPVLTLVLSVGIQWFLLKQVPPAFESMGKMIVNVKLSIPDANVYSEDVNNFLGTQVALMESDSVVNRVKHRLQSLRPELTPEPVAINVTILPKSGIFNLMATGKDPAYTQAYLKATMDEYISLKRDLLQTASTSAQFSMEEDLKQIAAKLQSSSEALLNYQSSNNVVFLQAAGGNNAAEYLSALTRKLAEDKSELKLLDALTLDQNLERQQGVFAPLHPGVQPQETKPGPKPMPPPSPAAGTQQNSNAPPPQRPVALPAKDDGAPNNMPPNLGELEVAYLHARQQLITLKSTRDVLIKRGISAKSQLMDDMNYQISIQDKLVESFQEQSQEQLKNRRYIIQSEIKNLEGLVQEWELKAMDVSKQLTAFEGLKDDQKRLQARYDQLQASLQTLEVDKGIGQESVTVLEPATFAESVPPHRLKHFVMAGLIGLCLGLGLLALIDRLNDRPTSPSDLRQFFPMPVLGQIPLMKAKDRNGGVPILQLNDNRYPLIEAYRSVRSALLHQDVPTQSKQHSKSIVITSACPHDGKSMVSANFAVTLAQAGARVLLIDADLRRGTLHKHFSVAANPGLAEVLARQCKWSGAVVSTSIPNLDVLPCGTTPHPSVNLFATPAQFLAEISGNYDYYVFDTAPVMVSDDVLSLSPHVDGVIMVIRAGATSGRITQAALDLLRARRVNVIGTVFNAVNPKSSDYHYYRFTQYYPQHPLA